METSMVQWGCHTHNHLSSKLEKSCDKILPAAGGADTAGDPAGAALNGGQGGPATIS